MRRLISPSGRVISLTYDRSGLIRQARDDAGHYVDYSYDSSGRLIVVHDSQGPTFRYTYDRRSADKMVTVENGDGQVLLRNVYDLSGRVSEQKFADGSRYGYSYELDGSGRVTQATASLPDGKKLTFSF